MKTTVTGASLAACAIAITIMAVYLWKWWRGGRAAKDLISMVQGFINGALSTICTGGLAGWLSGCTRQAAGGVGGKAVTSTTGAGSGGAIRSGSLGQLTPEGGVVVLVLFVFLVISYKVASKDDKGRLLGFCISGAILCVTAGIAGLLTGLPEMINSLGQSGSNMLSGNA